MNRRHDSTSSLDLSDIRRTYSGLGKLIKLGDSIQFYAADLWLNNIMTPILFDREIHHEDMKRLKRWLKRQNNSPYSTTSPFLVGLTSSKLNQRKLINSQEKLGWKVASAKTRYMVWRKPILPDLPAGFEIAFSKYSPGSVHAQNFWAASNRCFGSSKQFNRYLDRYLRQVADKTYVVLLRSPRGKVAASGLFTQGDKGAYLWCGCVMPYYRGRGLWQQLVAARQLVSLQFGTNIWLASSSNPRIEEKGDLSIQTHVLIPE